MPRMPRLAGFLVAGLMLVSGFSARAAQSVSAIAQPFTYTHTIVTQTTQLSGLSQKDFSELLQQLTQYATDHHTQTTWFTHTAPSNTNGLNYVRIDPLNSQPSTPTNSSRGIVPVTAGIDGNGADLGGQLHGGSAGGAIDVVAPASFAKATEGELAISPIPMPAILTPALVMPAVVTPTASGEPAKSGEPAEPSSAGVEPVEPIATAPSPTTLRLSEIYPNTTGDDLAEEFIELRNTGSEPVSLKGWILEDASGKQFIFKDSIAVAPGQYYVVDRALSKISLNNDVESVLLKSPDGGVIDQTAYSKTTEGSTFSLVNDQWTWTTERTPGAANVKSAVAEAMANKPATAVMVATPAPVVTATATPTPSPVAASTTPAVTTRTTTPAVVAPAPQPIVAVPAAGGEPVEPIEPQLPIVKTLRISELYPNTSGDDLTDEFIEIENIGTTAAPLKGWSLTDASGKTFTFAEQVLLQPGKFLSIARQTSKIALNNDADALVLTSPDNESINQVSYTKTTDGSSLALVNGSYVWSQPTPGISNTTPAVVEPASAVVPISVPVITAPVIHAAVEPSTSSNTNSSNAASSNIDAADGTFVSVEGTALVAPGVLGKQIFYLFVNGKGIQIFKSDAAFPAIQAGQSVRVNGELSTARDERRIKVSALGSIEPRESVSALEPKTVSIADINSSLHGQLISTEGQIFTRSKDSIVLEDQGVQLTLAISEYANIDTTRFAKGDRIKVRGVLVSQTNSLKLKPRSQNDLELIAPPVTTTSATTIVSGKDERQSELMKEAAYISVGTALVLIALLVKRYHPKFNQTYASKNSLAVTPQDMR